MVEAELRASIAAVGPLLPVLVWRGRVLDGSRRDAICGELGIICRTLVLHSLQEACTALWPLHPARAIALAGDHFIAESNRANCLPLPRPSARELAELCSTRVAYVARELARGRKTVKAARAPKRRKAQKTVLIQFWAEPQFKHYVQRAGALDRLDLSATLRVAAWEYVQRRLPRAPTEGSRRGASVESVRVKLQRK